MPSNWTRTTWGDLATLEYGKALRGYQESKTGFPVYGTNGPIGWHSVPLCLSGGVIIGRKGAYRGVHYSRTPFYVIDTAFYLKPKVDLDIRWAYYQLLTLDINGMDSGSAIPSTSRDEFYKLQVTLPPRGIQTLIADALEALDDRINLLRQTNTTLESIAQALFKSWFIDFDPVRARQAGREPEGMGAATAALFPAEFEESALGLIPKGWAVGTFGDLATLVKGTVNPLNSPSTLFEHYSLPAFDAAQLPVFETGDAIKSNKTSVPPGTVLHSKLNPHIPRVWFPSRVGKEAVCSTEFLPWLARATASPEVVYCVLTSPTFEAEVAPW